jgi:hypothetical protein
VNALKTVRDERTIFLAATDGGHAARTVGRELSLMLDCQVTVGASDPVTEPQLVPAKYQEALRCLEAYFDSGGSPTRAANQLFLHPNTVARRIDRIGELLGPTWQDGCSALEIQLAVRLYRIKNALPDSRTTSTDGPAAVCAN